MAVDTTKIMVSGDILAARGLVGYGNNLLSQLKNMMRLGGLNTYGLVRKFTDGSVVYVTSNYGSHTIRTYVPLIYPTSYDFPGTDVLAPAEVDYLRIGYPWVRGSNMYGCLGIGKGYYISKKTHYNTVVKQVVTGTITWKERYERVGNSPEEWMNWAVTNYDEYVTLYHRYGPPSYFDKNTNSVVWVLTKQYEEVETVSIYKLNWDDVPNYIKLNGSKYSYASTQKGTSFLIDKNNNMYCCGGNGVGQLGIGKPMGYMMFNRDTGILEEAETGITSGQLVPKFFLTTFTEVPGKWRQVSTNGDLTIALDMNYKAWMTGNYWNVDEAINVFTKIDNRRWIGIIADGFYRAADNGRIGFDMYGVNYQGKLEYVTNFPSLHKYTAESFQGRGAGENANYWTVVGSDGKYSYPEIDKKMFIDEGTLAVYLYDNPTYVPLDNGKDWIFAAGWAAQYILESETYKVIMYGSSIALNRRR